MEAILKDMEGQMTAQESVLQAAMYHVTSFWPWLALSVVSLGVQTRRDVG